MITICFLWVLSFNIKGFRKMDMQGLIRKIEIFAVDVLRFHCGMQVFYAKITPFA